MKPHLGRTLKRWWIQLTLGLATFAIVDVTWVLFRTHDLSDAWLELKTMCGHAVTPVTVLLKHGQQLEVAAIAASVVALHWRVRGEGSWTWWTRMSWPLRSLLLAVMIVLMLLTPGEDIEFIYFQF